jgi:hypothetical protein
VHWLVVLQALQVWLLVLQIRPFEQSLVLSWQFPTTHEVFKQIREVP